MGHERIFFNTSNRQKGCLSAIKPSNNLTKHNAITSVQLVLEYMTFGDFS